MPAYTNRRSTEERKRGVVTRMIQGESPTSIARRENLSRQRVHQFYRDAIDNAEEYLEKAKGDLEYRQWVVDYIEAQTRFGRQINRDLTK